MKKILSIAVAALPLLLLLTTACLAEEQTPGQPLYFPREKYQDHDSDLAPHTDPYWRRFQEQQGERTKKGLPQENPYDKPVESIYESSTHYEIVDDGKKGTPPPTRWGQ